MPLPDWIVPVKGFKSRYILDPDGFYPSLLGELATLYSAKKEKSESSYSNLTANLQSSAFYTLFEGVVDPKKPDQYWLEVCHQMVKLDTQVILKTEKLFRPDVSLVLIIRGKEGYIERWSLKAHEPGERRTAILTASGLKNAESVGDVVAVMKKADRRIGLEARQHYKNLRGFLPV